MKTIILAIALIMLAVTVSSCVVPSVSSNQTLPAPSTPGSAHFAPAIIKLPSDKVITGQPFSVTMKITNTGTAAGTYKANLFIDGVISASRNVPVNAGQAVEETFQATIPAAGHHIIGVGQQTIDVTVTDSRVPMTLKLDNGVMDGCNPIAESTSQVTAMTVQNDGGMIKLTAPPGGFTITGISMTAYIKDSTWDFNHDPVIGTAVWEYGSDVAYVEPVNPEFTINIYGDKRTKLYTGNFKKDLFTNTPSTVTMPVTNTNVSGEFYIEVLPLNLPKLYSVGGWDRDYWQRYLVHTWYHQLCIGYMNSNDPQSWISEGGTAVPGYYPTYNWLIRATGFQSQN